MEQFTPQQEHAYQQVFSVLSSIDGMNREYFQAGIKHGKIESALEIEELKKCIERYRSIMVASNLPYL